MARRGVGYQLIRFLGPVWVVDDTCVWHKHGMWANLYEVVVGACGDYSPR